MTREGPGRRIVVYRRRRTGGGERIRAAALRVSGCGAPRTVARSESSGADRQDGATRTRNIDPVGLRSAESWNADKRLLGEFRLDQLAEYPAATALDRPNISTPTRRQRTLATFHDSFTIERTYPASPSRAYAAFASLEATNAWADTGEFDTVEGAAHEFDFRVGGRERFAIKMERAVYSYDALYYDIVPDETIIYSYAINAGDGRIPESVTTICSAPENDATTLTPAEQGAPRRFRWR